MTGPDVTGMDEYAEMAAPARFPRVVGRCPSCAGHTLFLGEGGYVTCSRLECPVPDAASDLLESRAALLAEARAEERERIAAAIEACICNYGPSSEGPERECFRHGEEAAEFYLGHAARIARGEAT